MGERRKAKTPGELAEEIDEITKSILGATELIDSGIYGPWTDYKKSKSESKNAFVEELKSDSKFALHVLTLPASDLASDAKAIKFFIDELYSGRLAEPKKWRQLIDKCLELHAMCRSDLIEYSNFVTRGWHADTNES